MCRACAGFAVFVWSPSVIGVSPAFGYRGGDRAAQCTGTCTSNSGIAMSNTLLAERGVEVEGVTVFCGECSGSPAADLCGTERGLIHHSDARAQMLLSR